MAHKDISQLGQMLVDEEIITPEQLDLALTEHHKTEQFIGEIIIKLGFAPEEKVLPVLSKQIGIPYVKIKDIEIDRLVTTKVPAKVACHYKIMPVKMEKDVLTIAIANPQDLHTLDDLKLLLGVEVKPTLGGEKDILEGIREYYGIGADTIEQMMAEEAPEKELSISVEKTEDLEALAEDASVVKFVNELLLQAFKDRATDIHMEPFEDELRVRYRIDGVLYDAAIPPTLKRFQSAIISRIKIMSNLNIAERRLPQDGRMKVKVGDEEVDLRISVLPTPFGESVGIRLLSKKLLYSLQELGLFPSDLKILESMIKKPHGIIFVTGPTGSGKTTTLYACLNKINKSDLKIITIEDPIEYQLKGITQIQVHPKIGLTFATGLRNMLRHDPDVMMVGEVRDYETAEITIRVALTGHLVFSTLHTNDACGGITRLLDMKIEPYLVASSAECIIAQRLVRIICPECKEPVKMNIEDLKELGVELRTKETEIFEGKGCESCKLTGYKGRTGIYEFLVLDDDIKEMILKKTSADQIKKKALSLGMRTLRQDGLEKVMRGITTVSEVLRATQEE